MSVLGMEALLRCPDPQAVPSVQLSFSPCCIHTYTNHSVNSISVLYTMHPDNCKCKCWEGQRQRQHSYGNASSVVPSSVQPHLLQMECHHPFCLLIGSGSDPELLCACCSGTSPGVLPFSHPHSVPAVSYHPQRAPFGEHYPSSSKSLFSVACKHRLPKQTRE